MNCRLTPEFYVSGHLRFNSCVVPAFRCSADKCRNTSEDSISYWKMYKNQTWALI